MSQRGNSVWPTVPTAEKEAWCRGWGWRVHVLLSTRPAFYSPGSVCWVWWHVQERRQTNQPQRDP